MGSVLEHELMHFIYHHWKQFTCCRSDPLLLLCGLHRQCHVDIDLVCQCGLWAVCGQVYRELFRTLMSPHVSSTSALEVMLLPAAFVFSRSIPPPAKIENKVCYILYLILSKI